ncbi:hypothetical protein LOCC1_G003869 [Lachnellula occidentalis]|uniref:Uncharacterized protein n=1 Tax=Lachnellula occidentalis TaxID=215460 RepID=A0A8H8UIF9_9HELO|nr:hypothetical protein LOCC1_G003869 [Lachnellula occidentalis]
MKFTSIASAIALCASVASADSKLDVASVISEFYPTSTPKVDASVSTALASALYSVQSTWNDSPAWTSAKAAIYSAAPTSAQSSIDKSGYAFAELTTQKWYTKSVPHAVQTAVAGEVSAIDSAASKVLGTATSKGDAPRQTGMAVAGVVGVVGMLAVAL